MIERSVDTNSKKMSDKTDKIDIQFEESLRPLKFADYVGQSSVKDSLHLAIAAAKKRRESLDHVLLYGPPGLGKTTLAYIVGNEMSANVKVTSGPTIERAGDLASLLTNLSEGDILFVDEIHRLPRSVEEILYPAMEDYALDIMLGKGPTAQSLRLDLPKFTIVGATTRFGALSGPLRDRFGLVHRLEFYSPAEIAQIITRSASLMKLDIDPAATEAMARRARLTPRIANRLVRRVRDYAQVHGDGRVNLENLERALDLLEIDSLGLEAGDRRILSTVIEHYGGGPAGLGAIAAATNEERQTIEDVYEPYLIQIGFLIRTNRGRQVTAKAYSHLGIDPPATPEGQAKLL